MPKKEVRLGNIKGPPGNDAVFFSATAEADGEHYDVPEVEVELGGEPGSQTLHFKFKGLQGSDATIPIATTEVTGRTKPDDSTLTVDPEGTLSVKEVPAELLSGTIDLANLPQGALERLVPVENQEARFQLTNEKVQLGDVVQELDTSTMYVVVDEDNLDNESGYTSFSAGTATLAEAAKKLAQSVDINGVAFDGSNGITVYDDTKLPLVGGTLTGTLNAKDIVSTWLTTTDTADLNETPERYPVLDASGKIYYRTIEESKTDLDILRKSGDTATGLINAFGGLAINETTEQESSPVNFITSDNVDSGGRFHYSIASDVADTLWTSLQSKVIATKASNATHADVSDKLGTETVGSEDTSIYLNQGVATPVEKVKAAAVSDKLSTTSIEASTDLNSLKDSNKYYSCETDEIARTLTNSPTETAFSMRVEDIDSENNNYLQLITTDTELWFRAAHGDSFSEWHKIYPSEALNIDGVLPVESGGTGQTTLPAAENKLWLSTTVNPETTPTDDLFILVGDASENSPTRVNLSQLWNWVKPKVIESSVNVSTKLGTDTVGATNQPVYLDKGTPTPADPYPEVATTVKEGLVKPDGKTVTVKEDGTISAANAGPMSFEIDETDGHLYVYYEDTVGEPNVYINEEGHLIWDFGG